MFPPFVFSAPHRTALPALFFEWLWCNFFSFTCTRFWPVEEQFTVSVCTGVERNCNHNVSKQCLYVKSHALLFSLSPGWDVRCERFLLCSTQRQIPWSSKRRQPATETPCHFRVGKRATTATFKPKSFTNVELNVLLPRCFPTTATAEQTSTGTLQLLVLTHLLCCDALKQILNQLLLYKGRAVRTANKGADQRRSRMHANDNTCSFLFE